jgi:hypothetical protein
MNTVSPMNPGELVSEYRVRLAEERAEAQERRRIELMDLSSTANAPAARIRAWERAHGLTLPRDGSHPVLTAVAAATRLTLEQVQEEQQRRQTPVPTAPTA